ncbi:MAG: T9SS type A sorting domain-containing protein, partial [Dysgonamonadaceae bacterium]|nr:T9SS type A sorting domain-containing protein [Dysgonamonadaceae bacterium]
ATDFRVANGATDVELTAALEQAETGDVIFIDGWVTLNAPVHIAKNVTIKAGVDNAGFDGEGKTRLFDLEPEPIDGAKLVFDNLGFMNGDARQTEADGDGGAARIFSGVVDFVLCYFDSNQARRGGAFFIVKNADAPAGPVVTFKKCEATNNLAAGGAGESRGGYLFTDGDAHITHEYCNISANQAIGGRGGALCLFGAGTRRLYYTVLSSNKGGDWDENGIIGEGEYEGGLAFITGGATTFESCGIVDNKSWSHAGLIRGWGDVNTTVTFINSTIAKNQSMTNKPPMWIGGDATYTFVNSLFVENIGSNAGNGAGFDIDGGNMKLKIFNSVFARNACASNEGAVDISGGSNKATQITVKNSLIGLIKGDDSGIVPVDNPNIPTKSNIRMYRIANEDAQPDYSLLENSGIDFSEGIKWSKLYDMPYYLLTNGSTVTKLGDPALLADYDLNTDLFEQTRTPAADGSISAAPTLASTVADFDDTDFGTTGIVSPKVSLLKENIRIIGTVSNGILGLDFSNLRGQATGTLIDLTGREVEKVFNQIVVGKGYYDIHATPGIYILKVDIGGKTYAQKLIVTQ